MLEHWNSDSIGEALMLTSCVYGFLSTLLKGNKGLSADEWVERILGIIQTRYNEQISVAELAAEAGLERAYFSTLFKKRVGMSPHSYINSLRIRHACTLIESGNYTVSQIAISVGLDPRNFSRIFKKETGSMPSEYKKKP